ncbi:MAG: NAD-dependent epimerase/dehydratase family protein [Gemmatimonadetes bacterium]|nr:NAD-dependent epimerase/dehydratase family protein [Gemmatimonadota bacterium]
MTRILVTGADGFVGRQLVNTAAGRGHHVVAATRRSGSVPEAEVVSVGEVGPDTDWRGALRGVQAVVHLAARVHVMQETAPDSLAAFRRVNVAGSDTLARQAAEAGVRRLVFVSSIKVHGEATHGDPLREQDSPAPADPYGRSKLEAEQAVWQVADGHAIEVTVVRPVLVVGPGAGGNLRRLLALVRRGVPLPFAGLANRRSLIGRESLAELLLQCANHPAAAGETFLAADAPAVSTEDLILAIGRGLGRAPRLLRMPTVLGALVSWIPAIGANWSRLTGSLEVDAGKARRLLGWEAPMPILKAVEAMAAADRRGA